MIKKSIYLVITLFVILIIGILPLTNLPVSASSRGIIRSQTENTKIVSVVGGRVRIPPAVKNKLKEAWDHVSDFCSGVWEGITKP